MARTPLFEVFRQTTRVALAAERRVLARCADPSVEAPACSSWLIASATRRADILQQLVELVQCQVDAVVGDAPLR